MASPGLGSVMRAYSSAAQLTMSSLPGMPADVPVQVNPLAGLTDEVGAVPPPQHVAVLFTLRGQGGSG